MYDMGTLQEKRKKISSGESSQWGFRDIVQKREPLHDEACRLPLEKDVTIQLFETTW